MRDWGLEVLDSMRGLCELLDEGDPRRPYATALSIQEAKLNDPALTPSARSLEELRQTGESFFAHTLRMSAEHKAYFLDLHTPNEAQLAGFARQAAESVEAQRRLEASETLSFDEYLARYFAA
jgi:glutamate--cysteine ligase